MVQAANSHFTALFSVVATETKNLRQFIYRRRLVQLDHWNLEPVLKTGAGDRQPIFKHALTSHLDQSMRGSGRSVPWSARDTYRACPWGAFPYPPPTRRRKRPM